MKRLTIGVVLCKSLAALMDIPSGHSHCLALTRGGKPRIGRDGEYDGADCDGGDASLPKPLKRVHLPHPNPLYGFQKNGQFIT